MRKLVGKMAPSDPHFVWVDSGVSGAGTMESPLVFAGGGGTSDGNVDGGRPDSVYGGAIVIEGGGP